jgi:hypothetical protein
MLARFERVFGERIVRRHAHGDGDGLNFRIGIQSIVVAVGARNTELIGGCPRGLFMCRAHG